MSLTTPQRERLALLDSIRTELAQLANSLPQLNDPQREVHKIARSLTRGQPPKAALAKLRRQLCSLFESSATAYQVDQIRTRAVWDLVWALERAIYPGCKVSELKDWTLDSSKHCLKTARTRLAVL